MYKKYFLMKNEPFSTIPSPNVFYKSTQHTAIWQHIVNSLRTKDPVVMIPGEYGTGKTLLYLKLAEFMRSHLSTPLVVIPSSIFTFDMLIERVAKELSLPGENMDHATYFRCILEYFEIGQTKKNNYMYLVIDDIHDFGSEFIENLARFITLNIQGHFPVKLIMFAHTNFLEYIESRNMVSFVQRIKALPELAPLNLPEVTEYIYFRLIASGASENPVFDDEAVALICTASGGIPRLINKICDNSLMVAYKKKVNFIDKQLVNEVLRELGGSLGRVAESAVPSEPSRPTQAQSGPQHQYEDTNFNERNENDAANNQEINGPAAVRHLATNHYEYPSSDPENWGQAGKGGAEVPDAPEEGRENVFSDGSDKKAGDWIRKPEISKKSSLMDHKNLIIICLVLVVILMCLSFFRNFLMDSMAQSDVVKHKYMIVNYMDRDLHRVPNCDSINSIFHVDG